MRRRTFLSAVSLTAVGLAGCNGDGGSTPTETPTATATRTESPTDTATATETATPTPTSTTVEDPVERFAARLNRAVDAFRTDERPFAGVRPDDSVPLETVTTHLDAAATTSDELADANLSDSRRKRVNRLNGVLAFLRRSHAIHAHLVDAWDRHLVAWEAVRTGRPAPDRTIPDVRRHADAAEDDFNRLIKNSDPSDTGALDALSIAAYDRRVEGFRSHIDQFRSMADLLGRVRNHLQAFDAGIVRFENGTYGQAGIEFENAREGFASDSNDFASGSWSGAFEQTTIEGVCVTEAMQNGANYLQNQCGQLSEGRRDDPAVVKSRARERFENCDLIFESVRIVRSFYGEI